MQKGFRPFFLLGSLAGAVLVPWWSLNYDSVAETGSGLAGIPWHSHEMIFGFTMAIIAGFLLTAVENWTGRPTARGPFLAVLVALWSIGRLVSVGGVTASIANLAELSFLPVLTVAIAIPLVATRNRRNYLFLVLLPLLWLCDAHHHLKHSGLLPQSFLRSDLVAVDLIVVIMVVITGRIVPLFTRNAIDNPRIRPIPALNTAAMVATIVVAVVEVFSSTGFVMAVVASVAAILVMARTVFWGVGGTLKRPILWILHLGHAWIAVGLLLKAVASVSFAINPSVAVHALTAGAIGTLILGMLARVTLGHTGRTIETSPVVAVAFVLITVAALLRVLGPWIRPDLTRTALIASAICWSLAFSFYLIGNVRYLLTPRPDGKQG